jgi:PucR family transcriptional regulator, purine catabolism regulatory protein
MSAARPTARDLLAHPALADATLLGGRAGLDRGVSAVAVAARVDRAELARGAAVIVVRSADDTSLGADVAVRYAVDRHAALVLLTGPPVAESTGRIADRLRIPTLTVDGIDSYALARELDAIVSTPRVAQAEMTLATARAMREAAADPVRSVRVLSSALRVPVSIVDAGGAGLAGAAPEALPPALLGAEPRTLPASSGPGLLIACPIVLAATPEAWLVAGPVEAGPARAAATRAALEVAAATLTGGIARRRLTIERNVRLRAGLLAELLALTGPPSPHLAERLLEAGWRTAGWHVGVRLSPDGAEAARIEAATPRVEELLVAHGLPGPVVQGPDGWSTWMTSEGEPVGHEYRRVVRAVRALVDAATPELVLHAGVGAARAGIGGLAATLDEARRASVLAATAGRRPTVEHTGELGGRRLLLGSFGSDAFRAYAESLLEPLVNGHEPQLLPTLEAYLDHESSAASTAAALGVHRNTVAQRIRRCEQVLGVSLGLPDERLTLQLACRVLRARDRS